MMHWLWTPQTPGDVPPGIALGFAAMFCLLVIWLMRGDKTFRPLGASMITALVTVASIPLWPGVHS